MLDAGVEMPDRPVILLDQSLPTAKVAAKIMIKCFLSLSST